MRRKIPERKREIDDNYKRKAGEVPGYKTAMKPEFLCIGFQKCGTTTLYDILKQHGKIVPTEGVKEPMFYRVPFLRTLLGAKWYENRYFGHCQPEDGQIAGEVNAGLSFRGCADKIGGDFSPETKLIFLMRDPADRCYSAYKYFLALGFLPCRTVWDDRKCGHAEAFDRYVKSILGSRFHRKCIMFRRLKYLCFSQGNYARCIEEYLRYFPKENMKFVFFEEMIRDEQGTVEEILDFIQVERDARINYDIKSNESVLCAISPLRSKLIYACQGLYYTLIDFLHLGRDPKLRYLIRKFFHRIRVFCIQRDTDTFRMLPQTRQILNHYYKEEVARLEEIVGRKVPESWGRTV